MKLYHENGVTTTWVEQRRAGYLFIEKAEPCFHCSPAKRKPYQENECILRSPLMREFPVLRL